MPLALRPEISLLAILALVLVGSGWGQQPQPIQYNETYTITPSELSSIIDAEIDWVLSDCVRSSGAVAVQDERKWIVPYFVHMGLMGILNVVQSDNYTSSNFVAASEVAAKNARRARAREVTRHWVEWYLDHLECPDFDGLCGTVCDYRANATGEYSTNDYDSVDSYASLLLVLVRQLLENSPAVKESTGEVVNSEYLIFILSRKSDIEMVLQALDGVIQPYDGLAWAMVSYLEKYLMDNSENVMGLRAAIWLYTHVFTSESDKPKLAKYTALEAQMRASIDSDLWRPDVQCYAIAKHWDNSTFACDVSTWYPDAYAQLWPVFGSFLSPDSIRASKLYDEIKRLHPWWRHSDRGEPDMIMGLVAARMGRKEALDKFMFVRRDWIYSGSTGHRWPYQISSVGAFVEMSFMILTGSKWIGFALCNGTESWRSGVCGHGRCVARNTCECDTFWSGEACSDLSVSTVVAVTAAGVGGLVVVGLCPVLVIIIVAVCVKKKKKSQSQSQKEEEMDSES